MLQSVKHRNGEIHYFNSTVVQALPYGNIDIFSTDSMLDDVDFWIKLCNLLTKELN